MPDEVSRAALRHLGTADALLPGLIAGLYVTGSVALGDHQSGRSDIDFMAFTSRPLSAADLEVLAGLQLRDGGLVHSRPAASALHAGNGRHHLEIRRRLYQVMTAEVAALPAAEQDPVPESPRPQQEQPLPRRQPPDRIVNAQVVVSRQQADPGAVAHAVPAMADRWQQASSVTVRASPAAPPRRHRPVALAVSKLDVGVRERE